MRSNVPALEQEKMHEVLRFQGEMMSATVSRTANKWFVSLTIKLKKAPTTCKSQASVGVDWGIKSLATLSNGKTVKAPKRLSFLIFVISSFAQKYY